MSIICSKHSETGLIYLRNRYYDPTIGRFTQEDPAKDGLNWYVYCANDPVNMVDNFGTVAYELFSSPDAAAEDWAWNYYAKTDFSRYEQLSIIYKLTDGENTYYTYGSAVDIIDVGGTNPHYIVPSAADKFKPTDLGMEAEQYSFVHSHPSERNISDLDKEFVSGVYGGFSSVYAVVRDQYDPNLVDVKVYHDTRYNGYCTEEVVSNLRYDRSYLTEERRKSIRQRYEYAWYDHTTNNLIDGIYCYDGQDCPMRMWPNNRW